MISIDKCPVCGGVSFEPLHRCLDTTVSHETFTIKKCSRCQLGITSPRPQDSELDRYYHSENYISHTGTAKGFTDHLYLTARKRTLTWKAALVEKYCHKGSILDFGCGTGEFLATMLQRDWQITGVEPSEMGRLKAQEITQHEVCASLSELSARKFQAITLWHVLEHVPYLASTLERLNQMMEKDGSLFIAVPNYKSHDATVYREYWAGYDVPRHLWHFAKQSMALLLQRNGFTLKTIVPMKLDAYYISLLSEKNKKSPLLKQYVSAIVQGAISNQKGKPQTNHSSLLYIASPI